MMESKKCEICGMDATDLCLECISYYCDSCFKYLHDKQKINQHKKEKIDYYATLDTKCPEHPKIPNTLFCVDEKGKLVFY